jgi:hypothetical protein
MKTKTKNFTEDDFKPEELTGEEFKFILQDNGRIYADVAEQCRPRCLPTAVGQWIYLNKGKNMKTYHIEALKAAIGELNYYRSLNKARAFLANNKPKKRR